jgi:hypothetical protein
MNWSGYHEMKSSRKRTTHNSIEKIHAHDRLESARVPFGQGSRRGRKINAGYCIAEILEILSHCPIVQLFQWHSIEPAGNKLKLLVHANNARPRPSSYQFNILMRIE